MNNKIYLKYSTDIDLAIEFVEKYYWKFDYRVGYDSSARDEVIGLACNYIEVVLNCEGDEELFIHLLQYGSISNHFEEYKNT